MSLTNYPTNVIYNTHSPNQNSICINPDAKSVANTINDSFDFLLFRPNNSFRNSPASRHFIEFISERVRNYPQPSNSRRNQRTISTRNTQVQHEFVPQVINAPPVNISVPEVENILKNRFNFTHAKHFLKFAKNASHRIGQEFHETRKVPTLEWIHANWSRISQVLDDLEE